MYTQTHTYLYAYGCFKMLLNETLKTVKRQWIVVVILKCLCIYYLMRRFRIEKERTSWSNYDKLWKFREKHTEKWNLSSSLSIYRFYEKITENINTHILNAYWNQGTCKQVSNNNTNTSQRTNQFSKDEKHHLQITTLKNRKELNRAVAEQFIDQKK